MTCIASDILISCNNSFRPQILFACFFSVCLCGVCRSSFFTEKFLRKTSSRTAADSIHFLWSQPVFLWIKWEKKQQVEDATGREKEEKIRRKGPARLQRNLRGRGFRSRKSSCNKLRRKTWNGSRSNTLRFSRESHWMTICSP